MDFSNRFFRWLPSWRKEPEVHCAKDGSQCKLSKDGTVEEEVVEPEAEPVKTTRVVQSYPHPASHKVVVDFQTRAADVTLAQSTAVNEATSPRPAFQEDTAQGSRKESASHTESTSAPSSVRTEDSEADDTIASSAGSSHGEGENDSQPPKSEVKAGHVRKRREVIVDDDLADDATKTTLMVQNLPCNWTPSDLASWLNKKNLLFDLISVPRDFQKGINSCYGFVNFATPKVAALAMESLPGSSDWESKKTCAVNWATQQGYDANVKHFRNSPLLHKEVPEEYRPMLFDSTGAPAEWPQPTKTVKPPRGLQRRLGQQSNKHTGGA